MILWMFGKSMLDSSDFSDLLWFYKFRDLGIFGFRGLGFRIWAFELRVWDLGSRALWLQGLIRLC